MATLQIPGIEKVDHLVIVMMENRSFDHYLGALALRPEGRSDIDGLKDPPVSLSDAAGNPITSWCMDGIYSGYGDPPHGWNMQHANWNGGAMDGFVKSYEQEFPGGSGLTGANIPMGYYTRSTLPTLYALADNFTVCDHWFSSVLSSTWPNRKYLHSGMRDSDNDTQTLPPFPGFNTTPIYDTLERAVDPVSNRRCTWKCYYSDLPFLAFWYKFAASHALDNFARIDAFVDDCRENRLPSVSIIDPPFSLADDHPAHDVRLGQKFIGLIVDAITHSDSWQNTALVLLYDENGAFYDHLAPPRSFEAAGGINPPLDTPLGFRVPALVVSPYARRRAVCKTAFDHTSLIKSIHLRWNVEFDPTLFGARWKLAPDIWSTCFDFTQAPLPPGTYTEAPGSPAPLRGVSWEGGVHDLLNSPVGGVEAFLERIFIIPELKELDQRASVFDALAAMENGVVRLKRMV